MQVSKKCTIAFAVCTCRAGYTLGYVLLSSSVWKKLGEKLETMQKIFSVLKMHVKAKFLFSCRLLDTF